jgi:NAD(P)-dependent dehydrogenase (short-subunit alcohol dehydrogenase family)
MTQFTNKTVMITGAAGSVAQGMIDKFASTNANLVLIDYSLQALQERMAQKSLPDALLLDGDLGKPEAVQNAVDATIDRFGKIDVLLHTAGGFGMGDPVHAVNMDVFQKMMYVNAQLTYVTLGVVARHMVEKNIQGSMVAILAKAGLSGGKNMAAYSASKAAAERIVQAMAQELKDQQIRVNGIMPSIVDTPPNRKDMPKADFSKWVTPAQIADTAYFLASEDAKAITGASVPVYGRV